MEQIVSQDQPTNNDEEHSPCSSTSFHPHLYTLEESVRIPRPAEEEKTSSNSTEHELWDATMKMLRLFLNLCMNMKVGTEVASSSEYIQVIKQLYVLVHVPHTAG